MKAPISSYIVFYREKSPNMQHLKILLLHLDSPCQNVGTNGVVGEGREGGGHILFQFFLLF